MQRFFFSWSAVIITSFAAAFFLLSLFRTDATLMESESVLETVDVDVSELRVQVADSDDVRKQVEAASHRDRIIRNELLQMKPGEYVIQLPTYTRNTESTTEIALNGASTIDSNEKKQMHVPLLMPSMMLPLEIIAQTDLKDPQEQLLTADAGLSPLQAWLLLLVE